MTSRRSGKSSLGHFGRISRMLSGEDLAAMAVRTHRATLRPTQAVSIQRRLNEPAIDKGLKKILCAVLSGAYTQSQVIL
jgi:hypothetical protein